jgi:dihydroflavonol-4-reductase
MNRSGKSALVTGATGFIGQHLVKALLKRGDSVTCLIRRAGNKQKTQNPCVRTVIGDLANKEALEDSVKGTDVIYHVAGAIKAANRDEYFQINQVGTRNLLEAAAKKNPELSRFVHVSSLSAAGPAQNGRALSEQDRPNPISWYGESKLKSEQEVMRYAGVYPVTVLRPSAVYGPGDRETLLIFRMIKHGLLITPGRSQRTFSLIHADDFSQACIRAGESASPSGEIYFISRPETFSWEDIARAIARFLGKSYLRFPCPEWIARAAGIGGDLWSRKTGRAATINSQKLKELLQPFWICNPSKAMTRLGFEPRIDLESGIQDTVRWYQKHGLL